MKIDYYLFRTEDNCYVYIPDGAQFLLIHPLMFYLLKLNKGGVDIGKWIKSVRGSSVKIDEIGVVLKHDVKYQYKKMNFLLDAFSKDESEELQLVKLKGEDMERYMANSAGVTFEVTEHCNLSCEYCCYGKFYTNKQTAIEKTLSFDIAKNVLNFFIPIWDSSLSKSFNNKIVIGFYGGEPLLNFDVIERIVEYVKCLPIYSDGRVEFTMTTNGILLDRYISFLVENEFTIKISMDGGTAEENSFRKYHNGEIAFNEIYSNVINIKEMYPSFFNDNVDFISVLHKKNSESDVNDFFLHAFNKKTLISSLATDNINPESAADFWEMINVSLPNDGISSLQANNTNLRLPEIDGFIRHFCNCVTPSYLHLLLNDTKKKYYLPTGTCTPFKRILFITSDGKLLTCERIGHQFSLGETTDYCTAIDFDEMAEKYNGYYMKIYEKCRMCLFKLACSQCMFQTDDFDCHDFVIGSDENYAEYFTRYFSALENNPRLYLDTLNIKLI